MSELLSDKDLQNLSEQTGGGLIGVLVRELLALRERHREAVELLRRISGGLEELYRHGEHPWRVQVRAFLAAEQPAQDMTITGETRNGT